MKKEALLAISTCVLLLSCALPTEGSKPDSSVSISSSSPELEENEAVAVVRDGVAHLSWNAPDYDGFKIYGSASKYGEYRLLSGDKLYGKQTFDSVSYRYGYFKIMGVNDGKETQIGPTLCGLGNSTLIIDELDDFEAVQQEIDEVHDRLESANSGQFSDERFAAFFYPGVYDDVTLRLGYYSSGYGLGFFPDETEVKELYVSTNVLSNNNSTCTFWRNAENLSFPGHTQFAVSQATSLRRCHFKQNLYLAHPSGWSSGGFLADSKVDGRIESRTQQQWMSRGDDINRWVGSGHNYVFSGCVGNLPASSWSESTSRTCIEETTSSIAEMPFLHTENGKLNVFVPALEKSRRGTSWGEGQKNGTDIPLDDFYIAYPGIDDDVSLNNALKQGKNLLFVPGIYDLDSPLHVKTEDAVILGLGYATLRVTSQNRIGAMLLDDLPGIRVASLLFDAGTGSEYLLKVGEEKLLAGRAQNPIVLSDIFCRIGGAKNVHTEVDEAVVIYPNDVIGDNFWIWRADHSRGVAWNDDEEGNKGNPANVGLHVYGDRVICYGLMVEHFEKYQTLWEGDYGKTVMYQSEVPYRVPDQSLWMSHDGRKNGYASYKVADSVKNHYALGIGVYWVHYTHDFLESAIECPATKQGTVVFEHLVTTTFSGNSNGGIAHVINETGNPVGENGGSRALVEKYALVYEEVPA